MANFLTILIPMSRFGELLEKLARAEVRYVLVGGGAVLLHGHARTTADLDILIEATEENARRLLGTLATWGEGAGAELSVEELAVPQLGALRIVEDFPLDVFTLMRARAAGVDLSYEDLAGDALFQDLGNGVKVSYASIARLLQLKAGTGRPKDELDTVVLTEISHGLRERKPVDLAATGSVPATKANSGQGEWPLPPGER